MGKDLAKAAFWSAALCAAWVLSGCAHHLSREKAPRAFVHGRDTFAFANETVWNYRDGTVQRIDDRGAPKNGDRYTRHCFVVARASVQFWKFARFDPSGHKLGDAALAERVRELARIDVWREAFPPEKRVVFPGYADVHALSQDKPKVLQACLGQGWPTYFRPGNTAMLPPPGPGNQTRLRDRLEAALALRQPTILWLINFPSLSINHAVVVYRKEGENRYLVYDPNYAAEPRHLAFDPARGAFAYDKTFYFPGGDVDAHPVYDGPLQ
jgi:hypothetical protein